MTPTPCPSCGQLLRTFYRVKDEKRPHDGQCIAQCANTDCVLEARAIEGTGEHQQEAIEHFIGLALLSDRPARKPRNI